ncbi:MAG: PAS domain S-box protein [Trueperaceae bacterium]|nr:PAS domain S-box protein [Trueperaceae bacterium]
MLETFQSDLLKLSCKQLFSASELGLIVLTRAGEVAEVNQKALELLETTEAELGPKLAQLFASQQTKYLPFKHIFADLQLELDSSPILDGEAKAQGSLIRVTSLSSQKLLEQHLNETQWRYDKLLTLSERRAEEIALLHSIRDTLENARDTKSICQLVVERCAEVYAYNLVSLYLISGEELLMQYQVGYETFIERLSLDRGVMGRVARTGEAALINAETPDPDLIWAFSGIKAEVCVPLISRTRVIGVLNIESLESDLSASDLNLAKTLAAYTSNALERVELLETLQEREKTYRELVEQADDIIYTISLSGYFLYVNPATESLTGYSQEELKTRHYLELIRSDYRAQTAALYEQQFKQRLATTQFVYPILTAQGEERWLSQKVRLIWQDGRIIYMQAYARDMTSQVLAEQALESHTKALERANRDLQKFSFVSAHDLQEPLRKIQTFANRLAQKYTGQLDEQGSYYLERLSQSARRMQQLLEDIQVFSSIRSDNQLEDLDLKGLIKLLEKKFAPRLREASAVISYGDLPRLRANAYHMRLLFEQLIDNALKFRRPEKALQLRLDVVTSAKDLKLSFYDNGQGFDENYVGRMFEVFQTLHSEKEALGNGMGLALCRKIVEVYGGTISATSKVGEGSCFQIKLPLRMLITPSVEAETVSDAGLSSGELATRLGSYE